MPRPEKHPQVVSREGLTNPQITFSMKTWQRCRVSLAESCSTGLRTGLAFPWNELQPEFKVDLAKMSWSEVDGSLYLGEERDRGHDTTPTTRPLQRQYRGFASHAAVDARCRESDRWGAINLP
ncbi:hypothetical protein RMSM_03781 [Rhodopirellula maiorica SM1]|uniref:Uncharacterized protein n=1 Tax=Rhodopirellula maiorica SM1 TaxID=1265738 RepID=M5RV72_9BACT|nr:hypothetical protein RMSM_03781 [Rhodopirellula maiorica SM1]